MTFTSSLIATALISLSTATLAWTSTPTSVNFANANGVMLSALLFVPPGAAPAQGRGAVVMLHGCSGLYYTNDKGVTSISSIYREWADRLTTAGYVALAVDSFGPRNAPSQCSNGAGVGVSEIFDRPLDAVAGRNYLAAANLSVNAARIGLLGWSHGGSTVMATLATTRPVQYTQASPLATGLPFRVGVAFYPGAGLADSACLQTQAGVTTSSCWNGLANSVWDSYAPLALHHGLADTTTDPAYTATRATRAQASAGGASVSLTAYPNAVHSFDAPSSSSTACVDAASTPNVCAKNSADAATMALFAAWLN